MNIKPINARYSVSPQIAPEDLKTIAQAGFKAVICNRPNGEVPSEFQSQMVALAARAAGVDFHVLELTHDTMTPQNCARQKELIENAEGPVLAYCASGTRCSVVWALAYAPDLGAEAVLEATQRAGYPLDGLRPRLEALETQR